MVESGQKGTGSQQQLYKISLSRSSDGDIRARQCVLTAQWAIYAPSPTWLKVRFEATH